MKVGDYISVQFDHPRFGKSAYVYELMNVGVSCPHCRGKDAGDHGMEFKMLAGEGVCVVPGRIIIDCEKIVAQNLEDGITEIISKERAMELKDYYGSQDVKEVVEL
jgi:hypothetical protein